MVFNNAYLLMTSFRFVSNSIAMHNEIDENKLVYASVLFPSVFACLCVVHVHIVE